jgi:hypothetical protein
MAGLITPLARLAFAYLDKPRPPMPPQTGPGKYQATLIFGPQEVASEPFQAMLKAAETVAEEFFKGNMPSQFRSPFRRNEEKIAAGLKGFEPGGCFINVTTIEPPGLFDRNRQPILDVSKVYSGAWVRAEVTCFGFDKGGGKGVAFGLSSLQLVRDGERFGGADRSGGGFTPLGDEPVSNPGAAFAGASAPAAAASGSPSLLPPVGTPGAKPKLF